MGDYEQLNTFPQIELPMLFCICFMNQYTALGQAGVVGHLVQRHVEVEQSLDPDLVQSLNLPMAGKHVRVLRQ